MVNETPVKDEIFPKDSDKSYALVELMPRLMEHLKTTS